MGKIFKALEKAEKQDLTKPARSSAGAQTQVNPPETNKPKKPRPVVSSNRKHLAVEPAAEAAPVKPPATSKSADLNKHLAQRSISPGSMENQSAFQPNIMPADSARPERVPEADPPALDSITITAKSAPHTDNKYKEWEGDAGKQGVVDPAAYSELTEPRQTITSGPVPAPIQEVTLERRTRDPEARGPEDRTPVNVSYSKTKVQPNDPQKLKDNRVLSIFEEIDTSNQFKMLRTQVLRKLKAINGNSILVTSANPYEGKTFTSINLGVSIAKEFDRTVLIIDADIRRPTKQHTDFSTKFFSLNVEKGLTDYLAGEADIEEILINPGIDKLTLIPGGTPVDNSPELLNSSRMSKMIAEITSRYPSDRLVIVDGPAMLHFPDAMILSRYVDGVLPVVEAEKTPAEDMKKLINHLKEVNLLGMVLNKKKS